MSKHKINVITILITCILSCCICYPFAHQDFEITLNKIYKDLPTKLSMPDRINYFSELFLNQPYELYPLGEGEDNKFDQMPLFRLDSFDCETYVTTVLALALAQDKINFKYCLKNLRYLNGEIEFINRNHFTDLDWNINNAKQGFIADITKNIFDKNRKPLYQNAITIIDKAGWYNKNPLEKIRIKSSGKLKTTLANELQKEGAKFTKKIVSLPYLPIDKIIINTSTANFIFSQIPQGAIIEIVRPNWQMKDKIGTNLNISHLGFAIWKNGQLYFRQASSIHNKIVDLLLKDYLKAIIKNPSIKGINIQVVLPKKPLTAKCSVKE